MQVSSRSNSPTVTPAKAWSERRRNPRYQSAVSDTIKPLQRKVPCTNHHGRRSVKEIMIKLPHRLTAIEIEYIEHAGAFCITCCATSRNRLIHRGHGAAVCDLEKKNARQVSAWRAFCRDQGPRHHRQSFAVMRGMTQSGAVFAVHNPDFAQQTCLRKGRRFSANA